MACSSEPLPPFIWVSNKKKGRKEKCRFNAFSVAVCSKYLQEHVTDNMKNRWHTVCFLEHPCIFHNPLLGNNMWNVNKYSTSSIIEAAKEPMTSYPLTINHLSHCYM